MTSLGVATLQNIYEPNSLLGAMTERGLRMVYMKLRTPFLPNRRRTGFCIFYSPQSDNWWRGQKGSILPLTLARNLQEE